MAVLDRIRTILRANVNDLLDRSEDPEKALNQIVRDMADAIREARAQTTEAVAQTKLAEANLTESKNLAMQWQRKAEVAVLKGANDLALECIRRRQDFESHSRLYEQQLSGIKPSTDMLTRELRQLEFKYREIQRSRDMLIARHQVAKADLKIQGTVASLSISDPSGELGRVEDRIKRLEARSAAGRELAAGATESRWTMIEADSADFEAHMELLELQARLLPSSTSKEDVIDAEFVAQTESSE